MIARGPVLGGHGSESERLRDAMNSFAREVERPKQATAWMPEVEQRTEQLLDAQGGVALRGLGGQRTSTGVVAEGIGEGFC